MCDVRDLRCYEQHRVTFLLTLCSEFGHNREQIRGATLFRGRSAPIAQEIRGSKIMNTGQIEPIEVIQAKDAIRSVVYTYCRAIDRCDKELLLSCYHPGAYDDHGNFKGPVEEFAPWVMDLLTTMERTTHSIHNVLIRVDGDAATSEAYFVAYHRVDDHDLMVGGRYLDRFECRDATWRIANRRVVIDWNQRFAATGNGNAAYARGDRHPHDVSYETLGW